VDVLYIQHLLDQLEYLLVSSITLDGMSRPLRFPSRGEFIIKFIIYSINDHISQKSVCKLEQTNQYIIFFGINYMVKISCSNYGFDCEFESSGNDSMVIEKYQKHSMDEHGIEHSEEALEQLLIRKNY